MARFTKGQSGNPAGRKKGIKDRRVSLREKFAASTDDLVETVILFAKSGDMQAMRIAMDRIIPPIKEERIQVAIPSIKNAEDCTRAQATVLNAVAAGELLPSEGQTMASLIDAQRRAYETTDLVKRLEAIEQAINPKANPI